MRSRFRRTMSVVVFTAAVVGVGQSASASAPDVRVPATPRVALPQLPSNCGWLPWYDLMSWWYGQAGYCFENGHMIFFDWDGNYGPMA